MADYRSPFDEPEKLPGIYGWVQMCTGGRISTKAEASKILLGFAVVLILISLYLAFSGGGNEPIITDEYIQDVQNIEGV